MTAKDSDRRDQRTREKLLQKHKASEVGAWEIIGEDPNADFGGYHHQPLLATVEGTYGHAIEYALSLPNFYSWGGGGEIRLYKPPTIVKLDDKSIKRRRDLEDEKAKLEKRLAAIEKELKGD